MAAKARPFFAEDLTPELRAHAHFSWEGHDPGFQRELARAGLLYPTWPKEHGGQNLDPYGKQTLDDEFHTAGWGDTRSVRPTSSRAP